MTLESVVLDELPFYVSSEERILEIQGESLNVLTALQASLGHLRKFLVDHSVIPLFEKTVSLFPCCLNRIGNICLFNLQMCHGPLCSIMHQHLKIVLRRPGLINHHPWSIHLYKLRSAVITLFHLRGSLYFLIVKLKWNIQFHILGYHSMDKILQLLDYVLLGLGAVLLLLLLRWWIFPPNSSIKFLKMIFSSPSSWHLQ